ncbi:Ferrochelatase [Helicobacter ailurogastricus]|uniref:hypothetical protein n=1 Tax=Helicobacter ailurogastricus TaxID=1578720 RepID=UPI000CF09710|nr:hypothetical protein [Helicobacter ailurogastricus]GMB90484.1 Ferrochelatase [Helicobacter ailurogastricus]GMB92119.1 Ferrochelatase [Helicobacter ailurogastricus]
MDVCEVVAVTRGVLKTEPFVRTFTHATAKLDRVRRGSLFAAFNPSCIEEAVRLGAYGVLFEKSAPISDPEIAWICVENLQEAVNKLLYYKFLDAPLTIFTLTPLELELFSKLAKAPGVCAFEEDTLELLNLDLNNLHTLLLTHTPPKLNAKKPANTPPFTLLQAQLFSMALRYKDQRHDLKISGLYTLELARVLNLCEDLGLEANLSHLGTLNSMQPHYTNKRLELCAFGQSERILIHERQVAKLPRMLAFVKKTAPYHKPAIFSQEPLALEHVRYQNLQELQDLLCKKDFSLGFVLGEISLQALWRKPPLRSLFDSL